MLDDCHWVEINFIISELVRSLFPLSLWQNVADGGAEDHVIRQELMLRTLCDVRDEDIHFM